MPRRNHPHKTPKRATPVGPEQNKVRYASRAAAERQIKEIQKYDPDINLSVYQAPSGGWYLTSSR